MIDEQSGRVLVLSRLILRRRKRVTELLAVLAPVSFVGAAIVVWSQLRRW